MYTPRTQSHNLGQRKTNSLVTLEEDQTLDDETPKGAVTASGQVAEPLAKMAVKSPAPKLMEATFETDHD